jgi:hypothetical protein
VQLAIVHSHFRPGGVRRVIELATPHLVAHWPERIRSVVLAAGEAPDPAWLKAFRARLQGTPIKVLVVPAFGYVAELAWPAKRLEQGALDGAMELCRTIAREECLIWAHNLGLGRNLYLARELSFTCAVRGIPLVVHHHDWWFENRWHLVAGMQQPGFQKLDAVASAVLASARRICHAAINRADASVLEKHFPGLAGWLPNPVEPGPQPPAERVHAARVWLSEQLGGDAPVWLLPCRLLRRKNIAEALLLTRWLRPTAWLVTTGGVSSAEEQAYGDTLAAAAQAHGWRLRLGLLQGNEGAKPSVPELLAASEAILFTSLQEGFGLPYLEATAAGRPLVARRLPNIAPDLARFGFTFPHCYRETWVAPALFGWNAERRRQAHGFAQWKRLMPRQAARLAGKPALLAAGATPRPVPFSRLTLTAQLEVLAKPIASSWELCAPLNPSLPAWRKLAAAGRLKAGSWPGSANGWLSGPAYARRFMDLVFSERFEVPPASAGQAAQAAFLRQKLRAENIYPLLWNSRT